MKRMTCIVVGFLLGCGAVVQGTNRYVSLTGGSSSFYTNWACAATNIQDAVNVSSSGDIIYITNGTYTLTNQVTIGNITLEGVNGSSNTFINGNYPITTNRCFYMAFPASSIISGLTISNGYAPATVNSGNGGGVYVENGCIRNCVISDNTAEGNGGGVYFSYFNNGITNSTITRNSALNIGGGVGGSYNIPVEVRNCMVSFNSAFMAGGINLQLGLIENCVISNNSAISAGGLLLEYATIARNSVIVQNTAGTGGGIWFNNSSSLEDCLIMNNNSTNISGGIYANSSGTIRNCTIVSNSAAAEGGGIYAYNFNPNIINTIIYSNTAPNGPSCYYYVGRPTFTNCCMPGLTGSGNTADYPRFADWANNNYRLKINSPCLDSGMNQDWMTNSVDLDGHRRIDRISGRVDMGAYEFTHEITLFIGH